MKLRVVSTIIFSILFFTINVSGSSPVITVPPPEHIECSRGEGLIIKCHAEGTKPIHYTWIKNGIEVGDDEALLIKNVRFEDQGDYICVVRNLFGIETSSVCKLTINKFKKIDFFARPHKGILPLTVNFTCKSISKNEQYFWDFGDSTYSRQKDPEHIYRNSGNFRVTLIVKAPGFNDSLTKMSYVQVSTLSRNKPHKLSKKYSSQNGTDLISLKRKILFPPLRFFNGKYVGNDSLEVIFSNYDALNYPGIDTILVWYGIDPHPDFTDNKHLRKIDPGFFYSDSEDDSIFVSIKDPLFSRKADSGFCAILMISRHNAHSDTFFTSFSLKNSHPVINTEKRNTIIYPMPLQIINSYTDQNHIIHVIYSPKIPKCKSVNVFCSKSGAMKDTYQTFLFNSECKDSIDSIQFDPDRFIPDDNTYEISLWPQDFSSNLYTPDESGKINIDLKRLSARKIYSFDSLEYPVFGGSVYVRTIRSSKGICNIEPVKCLQISRTISIGMPIKITPVEIPVKVMIGFPLDKKSIASDIKICSKAYDGHDSVMLFLNTFKDTTKQIVWSELNIQNEMIILPIIDTIHPEITVVSDTGKIVKPGTIVNDTLIIKDDIPGCRWKFTGGEAGSVDFYSDSGFISSSIDTLTFSLPSKLDQAYTSGGLRIVFQLKDGTWSKTVDLSRKVIRVSSEIPVAKMSWTPITTTFNPWFSVPESVFINLCNEKTWKYCTQNFRIFKLNNKEDNHDNSWSEYTPKQSRNFSLKPGTVIWVKSKDAQKIVIPAGITFPLKDTFSILLEPRSWNDFAIPYVFRTQLYDIIKSTGTLSDSIDFFAWENDNSQVYHLSPLFIDGLIGKKEQIILDPGKAYCAFNPTSREIVLKIPPVSSKKPSTSPISNPNDSSSMATICILNKHNEILNEIAINGRTKIIHSPVPVSISGINFQTPDDSVGTFSQVTTSQNENSFVYHLKIVSTSANTDSIQLRAVTNNKSFEIKLFNPSINFTDEKCFQINSGERKDIWFIYGTGGLVNSSIDSLNRKTLEISNIVTRKDSLIISNWIPFGGLENVSFSICEGSSGAIVWHQTIGYLEGGPGFIVWDGETDRYTKASAGFYIIKISGLKEKGKTINASKNIFYSRDPNETF